MVASVKPQFIFLGMSDEEVTAPITAEGSDSPAAATSTATTSTTTSTTTTAAPTIDSSGGGSAASDGGGAADSDKKSKDSTEEIEEDEAAVNKKAKALANAIMDAKHLVVFTGAGISTSAAIPDFRGPKGVWTLRDKGEAMPDCVSMEEVTPTLTHMAIVALRNAGIMKYLVSQNVDGLHRRSGILETEMSELHGNCFLEQCSKCHTQYLRDFDVCSNGGTEYTPPQRASFKSIKHMTGRRCDDVSCCAPLTDSIINFGESLPEDSLNRAYHHSEQADLYLCLGSSLRVRPACKLPLISRKAGHECRLVIVNLQRTPLDDKCDIRIFAKIDVIMSKVMQRLRIDIPLPRPARTKEEAKAEYKKWVQDRDKALPQLKLKDKEELAIDAPPAEAPTKPSGGCYVS
ncbi:silent information regulator family protein [Pelomyxa schiedti]|nr:silent information regulator family protein [Pelomyxa schiedti]